MATQMQLIAALRAAHEAGDTDAAIKIAGMIRANTDTTPPPDIPKPAANDNGGAPAAPNAGGDPSAGGGMLNIAGYQTNIHTPQWLDRTLAGAGQSFVDTGRGIQQLLGGRSSQQVADDQALDRPLDSTAAGIAGNVLGGAAQFAIPGTAAGKVLSAAGRAPGAIGLGARVAGAVAPELGGAAIGAVAPVTDSQSRLRNAAVGAAAAGAGSALGDTAQSIVRAGADKVPAAARSMYDLGQKYGIDLRVPQLSDSPFMKHYTNLVDSLPLSGADNRYAEQRAQVNDAVGRASGVTNTAGALSTDQVDAAKDAVGGAIGQVAANHTAIPTQSNIRGMMNVLADAQANATPENQAAVEAKIRQLLSHVDPNTGTIPGTAWRQANTALQRQIRSTNDGDLKHYLGGLQDHFMDMMEQGIPQTVYDGWQALRGQYRNLKSIEPLAEKAGNTGDGINPALIRQRLITSKNNRGDLSDIADVASRLRQTVPNSGTAQKNMIAGAVGLAGAGAHTILPALDPYTFGSYAVNNLVNRGLNSKLAAKYYISRLPDSLAKYVNPAMDAGMSGGAAEGANATVPDRQDAEHALTEAGESGALVGHAEGGQPEYHKTSTWDLLKQGWKDLTTPSDPPPTPANTSGTVASGSKGADFDNWVSRNVNAASQ